MVGVLRRLGLDHDPLDHPPVRRHFSARTATPCASIQKSFRAKVLKA
jgi:hypothetical protein